MRLIDGVLLLYVPSIVSIAVTRRNQRPGDIAAGTIVTREHPVAKPARKAAATSPDRPLASDPEELADRWDTSAVTPQEVAAVRRFLERRGSLERGARRELAVRLADGLRPKVSPAPSDLAPEQFLEELERIKRTR